MTSATVPKLNANAKAMIIGLLISSRMASAAPHAAPEDAPRMSGAAMGFWNTP